MARPTRPKLTIEERGALALVAYGWTSVAEAAAMLQVHRSTMARMCAAAGVDSQAARRRHLARLQLSLTRYGHRKPSKAEMTARSERLRARQNAPPDTKSDT